MQHIAHRLRIDFQREVMRSRQLAGRQDAAVNVDVLVRRDVGDRGMRERLPRPADDDAVNRRVLCETEEQFHRLLTREMSASRLHLAHLPDAAGIHVQAVCAGVPQLIRPLAFDQFDNARRAEGLGVARGISSSDFTPEKVAKALIEVGSSKTMEACRDLARRMEGDSALADAAAVVEGLGGSRRRIRSTE